MIFAVRSRTYGCHTVLALFRPLLQPVCLTMRSHNGTARAAYRIKVLLIFSRSSIAWLVDCVRAIEVPVCLRLSITQKLREVAMYRAVLG